eukprot:jgi/Psemu1/7965/gm1.7965_g
MEPALIGQELNNGDNDSVSDDNCFSPNNEDEEEAIGKEGNNTPDDDFPPDLNMAIMTPNAGRHASDRVKVKIKLIKIIPGQGVLKDIYATVPEIEGDGFEPLLINWCYKKSIGADIASHEQIYVQSFQKALHSLLTNVTVTQPYRSAIQNYNKATMVNGGSILGKRDAKEIRTKFGCLLFSTWMELQLTIVVKPAPLLPH